MAAHTVILPVIVTKNAKCNPVILVHGVCPDFPGSRSKDDIFMEGGLEKLYSCMMEPPAMFISRRICPR